MPARDRVIGDAGQTVPGFGLSQDHGLLVPEQSVQDHHRAARPPGVPRIATLVFTLALAVAPVPAQVQAQARRVIEEAATFRSDSLTLAGTLFRPDGAPPSLGIVLLHGSGATLGRDQRELAAALARAGMVVLTFDKRGVGASQGPPDAWRRFNFADLGRDAVAALRYLQGHPAVDRARTGFFGISQSGWVAPLAAAMARDAAFLVMLSSSVATVAEDNLFERGARLRAEGFTEEEVAAARAMQELELTMARSGEGWDAFQAQWARQQGARWFRRVYRDPAPAGPDHPYRLWQRTVIDVDPVPTLEALDLPIYWIFGDPAAEMLSPVATSRARVEALRTRGKRYDVHWYPGADHNLRVASHPELDLQWQPPLFAWLRSLAP